MANLLNEHDPRAPVYVERSVNGRIEWLRIMDWYWPAWSGCFCRIERGPAPECPVCGDPSECDPNEGALLCRACTNAKSEPSEWGELPAI